LTTETHCIYNSYIFIQIKAVTMYTFATRVTRHNTKVKTTKSLKQQCQERVRKQMLMQKVNYNN